MTGFLESLLSVGWLPILFGWVPFVFSALNFAIPLGRAPFVTPACRQEDPRAERSCSAAPGFLPPPDVVVAIHHDGPEAFTGIIARFICASRGFETPQQL